MEIGSSHTIILRHILLKKLNYCLRKSFSMALSVNSQRGSWCCTTWSSAILTTGMIRISSNTWNRLKFSIFLSNMKYEIFKTYVLVTITERTEKNGEQHAKVSLRIGYNVPNVTLFDFLSVWADNNPRIHFDRLQLARCGHFLTQIFAEDSSLWIAFFLRRPRVTCYRELRDRVVDSGDPAIFSMAPIFAITRVALVSTEPTLWPRNWQNQVLTAGHIWVNIKLQLWRVLTGVWSFCTHHMVFSESVTTFSEAVWMGSPGLRSSR